MTVRVIHAVSSTPGERCAMLVAHFGICGEPRNTTREKIVAAFSAIKGVEEVGAPEAVIQHGTWSMLVAHGMDTESVRTQVLQIAKQIAARG